MKRFRSTIKIVETKIFSSLKTVVFTIVALVLVVMLMPASLYKLGNIFFGGMPLLYNVTLANFFFVNAAYPLIGKAHPYAHHQLSRTYFIQGDLKSALDEAKKELVVYPENYSTYYILGLTYGYMNEEQRAIEAFSKYIEYNPPSWAARNDMAWLQFRTGDIDGALKTMEPAYKSYPNTPWVLNTYGVLLMNKKDYQKAYDVLTHGKEVASTMTKENWGRAYPGNDPQIYEAGLKAMQKSFDDNLALVQEKMSALDKSKK